jgi:mannose-1-phosphate guanylyltransferase/mannose-1-phosphate guanylyltransferase/mannose-6-phosphate isomerase
MPTESTTTGPITPVLLSGGSGTRLWPVSRALHPKQLQPLLGERTMLQETALRLAGDEFAAPLIVCNEEHRFTIAAQLQAVGVTPQSIVLEPKGRNTAPAAAVAAMILKEQSPDTLMMLAASDHAIDQVAAFHAAVKIAANAAREGYLVSIGVKPTRPETGYGYIDRGPELRQAPGAFAIRRFMEKPNRDIAERFVKSGTYLWNASIFLFRASTYLEELEKYAPDVLAQAGAALSRGKRDLDFMRLDKAEFERCPSISIDYAVMERTKRAAVVPADIGWSDVGSWSMLWERGAKDKDGNATTGDVIVEDSRGNLIRSESRLVAALGVDNLVIIATNDAVLVAPRERDQDVKRIVGRLLEAGRTEASQPARVYRPWGSFETLHMAQRSQVKLIEVNPGAALSLQYHHKRAEHWVVVKGQAWITRADEAFALKENESTFIPIGMPHRLENKSEVPLWIIEVQVGSYLGEDDIVRLEDRYKRTPST